MTSSSRHCRVPGTARARRLRAKSGSADSGSDDLGSRLHSLLTLATGRNSADVRARPEAKLRSWATCARPDRRGELQGALRRGERLSFSFTPQVRLNDNLADLVKPGAWIAPMSHAGATFSLSLRWASEQAGRHLLLQVRRARLAQHCGHGWGKCDSAV